MAEKKVKEMNNSVRSKGSKKYRSNKEQIKKVAGDNDILEVSEAVKVLMGMEQANFKTGPSVELHLKLGIDPTKSDQLIRSSVVLPHGTGKEVKVAAFVTPENVDKAKKAGAVFAGGEDLVAEIEKSGKVEFDVAIAEPKMMAKLAKIARILGTSGVMPNPKTQTVGEDIEGMITTLKSGKVNFKNDKTGNIHIVCGKVNKDFDQKKLVENIEKALEAVEKAKPDAVKKKLITSAYICSTQSPSIRIV